MDNSPELRAEPVEVPATEHETYADRWARYAAFHASRGDTVNAAHGKRMMRRHQQAAS